MPDETPRLIAYELYDNPGIEIVPAPLDRRWMSEAQQRFPYRCLPLNIANQNGWVMLNPTEFSCYWYGTPNKNDIDIRFPGRNDTRISSHFGEGVLTFTIPYLFRTAAGINLWVKGPANHIKDGIQALEGVVETDWVASTFTMNWKITRPNEWITFHENEPFCMILPIPRGLTEQTEPIRKPITSEPALKAKYDDWQVGRSNFLGKLQSRDPEARAQGWQKDYFKGETGEGTFDQHQTKLNVKDFKKETA